MRTECVPARLRAAPAFRLAAAYIPTKIHSSILPSHIVLRGPAKNHLVKNIVIAMLM